MNQFHRLQIDSVVPLTSDSVKISFAIPPELKTDYSFVAGQYLSLKTTINGETVIRDYSICSSPSSGELSVGIKRLNGGIFSGFAQSLKVGEILEVRTPQGRFVLEQNIQTFVGIAAGSGITPIMSLLQHFLEHSTGEAHLIYGNKTPEDSMFVMALKTLKNTHRDRLHLHWIYSRIEMPEAVFGRINAAKIESFLKEFPLQVGRGHFYLCGPNDMVQEIKGKLTALGHPESTIRYELFFVPTEASDGKTVSEGKTNITLVLDGESVEFEMNRNQFVLDAALAKDLDAPYSCKGGVCSSCIAKVTEGSVEMAQNNVLTDADLKSGYVLTCQSRPTSASLRVDYDDV